MSRGGGRQGNRAPAPVETAEVVSLAHDGRGVAKIEGKAIFVAGALPGEQITLQRLRKQRSADRLRKPLRVFTGSRLARSKTLAKASAHLPGNSLALAKTLRRVWVRWAVSWANSACSRLLWAKRHRR